MNCAKCGKEFEPTIHNKKFCTIICKKESYKERNKDYYTKNKDTLILTNKQRYDENKERYNTNRRVKYMRNKDKISVERKELRKIKPLSETSLLKKRYSYYIQHGGNLDFNKYQEHFNKIKSEQGNECGICHKAFQTFREIKFDHNHKTGHLRGFLCNSCNNGLGRFFDNVSNLEKAIHYLNEIKK